MDEPRRLSMAVDGQEPVDPAQRRQADIELYELLRVSGFATEVWARIAWRLAAHGQPLIEAWLRSGVIVAKCREQGHGPMTLPLPLQRGDLEARETRRELAGETVAVALRNVKQALRDGKWDPQKGRSLRTYFCAACLYAFPNVLREWQRCENRWRAICVVAEDTVIDHIAPRFDPVSDVISPRFWC